MVALRVGMHSTTLSSLGLFALALGTCLAIGCGGSPDPSGGGGTNTDYSVPTPQGAPVGESCNSGGEGCPCNNLGEQVACNAGKIEIGKYVMCGGHKTCDRDTGTWTACVPNVTVDNGSGTPTGAAKPH